MRVAKRESRLLPRAYRQAEQRTHQFTEDSKRLRARRQQARQAQELTSVSDSNQGAPSDSNSDSGADSQSSLDSVSGAESDSNSDINSGVDSDSDSNFDSASDSDSDSPGTGRIQGQRVNRVKSSRSTLGSYDAPSVAGPLVARQELPPGSSPSEPTAPLDISSDSFSDSNTESGSESESGSEDEDNNDGIDDGDPGQGPPPPEDTPPVIDEPVEDPTIEPPAEEPPVEEPDNGNPAENPGVGLPGGGDGAATSSTAPPVQPTFSLIVPPATFTTSTRSTSLTSSSVGPETSDPAPSSTELPLSTPTDTTLIVETSTELPVSTSTEPARVIETSTGLFLDTTSTGILVDAPTGGLSGTESSSASLPTSTVPAEAEENVEVGDRIAGNRGVQTGIVLGSIAGMGLLIVCALVIYRMRRRRGSDDGKMGRLFHWPRNRQPKPMLKVSDFDESYDYLPQAQPPMRQEKTNSEMINAMYTAAWAAEDGSMRDSRFTQEGHLGGPGGLSYYGLDAEKGGYLASPSIPPSAYSGQTGKDVYGFGPWKEPRVG